MKGVSILILLFGLATLVWAQNYGLLVGTLQDSETARPIAGATVRIMAVNIEQQFSTLTDDQGRFAYVGLPDGMYLVTIAKEGYAPLDVFDLLIERGEQTRLRLNMMAAARAPFKRQLIRYRRPLINTEDATIKHVFRTGT